MYNLVKILTEEPKKIEKLLILLSKIILTFFLTSCLYGHKISLGSIVKNPIPDVIPIEKIIYFFSTIVIVWYILWGLLLDGLLTELPIWLITRKKTGKAVFDAIASWVDIAYGYGSYYKKGKHIVSFTNSFIKKEEEFNDLEETTSRFREYYQLALLTFLSLLIFSDVHLHGWTIYFFLSMIAGFFVLSIFTSLVHKYFSDNYDSLLSQFLVLSYEQKVHQAVEQNLAIKVSYNVEESDSRVNLIRKYDSIPVPHKINVFPVFHKHEAFGQAQMESELKNVMANNLVQFDSNIYTIVVSNVEPSSEMGKLASSRSNYIYVSAKTDSDIIAGIELALHKINVGFKRFNLLAQNSTDGAEWARGHNNLP
jgi:hypothetical protein